MAFVVQRATLFLHLKLALLTPFDATIGVMFVYRRRLILFCVTTYFLIEAGLIPIQLPEWEAVLETLIIAACIAIPLMIIGAFLTAYDHLRFGGWTDCGPEQQTTIAEEFITLLVEENFSDAREFVHLKNAQTEAEIYSKLQRWNQLFENDLTMVRSEDIGTVDHVFFREAVQYLKQRNILSNCYLVMVPMIETLNLPVGSPMKLAMCMIEPASHRPISGFAVVAVCRPTKLL
ncbi:hypothetical protein OAF98_00090 [Planctomicrobium sp.]|jgi:hypothetical protein|nr:hypothetical protein [Planctomicrobium sp.]MBT5019627.1 hypothetical protein [Planctomicrobium sp.]MDB4731227.1 hypothetical protein [bacterium]MDB4742855.1 hypothetical protein [Planctomicrobium sp.]